MIAAPEARIGLGGRSSYKIIRASGAAAKYQLFYCDFPRAVIGQITSTLSLRMP
jgi:hypothetical protein